MTAASSKTSGRSRTQQIAPASGRIHATRRAFSRTQAAVRAERLLRLQEALNALEPLDREILSLRHFEELTHAEAARVLEIEEAAAAKRYIRALKRLKDVLTAL